MINLALAVVLVASQGYTYGRTADGKSFWQQCNPNGYCYGREDNKPFWFQEPNRSEPWRKSHETGL